MSPPQRPGRRTVRSNQLERYMDRVLEEFNQEMAGKVAQAIGEYHRDFVEPRLAWLERPWWLKLWHFVKRTRRPDPVAERHAERPPEKAPEDARPSTESP